MRKNLLLVLVLVISAGMAMAQERTVSGKVTAADDGSTIPGANVLVKGTSNGTVTDIDGNYKLTVPAEGGILVFSFVGYETLEVTIGSRSVVDVALKADVEQLEEVVVVGYGTTIKQDLLGNIASVSGEDIELQPITTVEQAIQGRTAGVLITSQNGKLGQGMDIRIRGASSISASNQPLYVIDGIPVTSESQSRTAAATNPMADINFNDIESIEVLKDASAAAIYGSRGANGVVLITTKRGKAGKTRFDANLQYGFSKPTRNREWINAEEYIQLYSEAAFNNDQREWGGFADLTVDDINPANYANLEAHPDYPGSWLEFMVDFMDGMDGDYVGDASYASINPANTDWQQQAYQQASALTFDLSASGGGEKTSFFISGSYTGQDGILLGNAFERLAGRINLNHEINQSVNIGFNYNIARTENDRVANDNFFSTPLQLVAQSPITPVTNENGFLDNALNPGAIYYPATVENANADFITTVYRNLVNTYLQWDIVDDLSFRAEYGFDLLTQDEQTYQNAKTLTGRSVGGYGSSRWVQIFNYTTKGYFTWSPTFSDAHDLDFVLGMEFQESNRKQTNVEGQGYPVNELKTVASAAEIVAGNSTLNEFAFVGYFGRLNYKFNNKYLVGVTARIDGSSRFGENNRYGVFPSGSVGWIVSEEGFLNNSSLLSFLKLRASYGLTGNAAIPNYSTFGTFTSASYNNNSALVPEQIANPDLTWETTTQLDIGLDFAFFDDKLSGGLDYYQKNTRDLLLNVPIPGTTGFRTQFQNIGALQNTGFEVVLNYRLNAGDFEWVTSLNAANNRNEVTQLVTDDQIIDGPNINKVVVGQPIGVFWGIEYAGVDPDNGDALWYLPSGETTNDYNVANAPENRKALGDPNPAWIYGWNNSFTFKGFDLSFMFQGVNGNMIYLAGDRFMAANARFEDNQTRDQLARWRKPGDITDVPQARLYRTNGAQRSSRYLSDGSYLRLKTLSFGYSFPKKMIENTGFTNLRVYVNGYNLLTFTDYKGWDPEVNTDFLAGNIGLGNDFYSAPQPKTITFGIRAGF